jgi:hypothetical protein
VSTTERQMPIVDGGPKDELLVQLHDIGRVQPRRTTFRLTVKHPTIQGSLAPQVEIGVFVNGIEAEDGSGNCWIFNGYVIEDELLKSDWLQAEFEGHYNNFHGFYNSRTRKGFIYAGVKAF